jgi:hypothetical protein
MFLPLAHTQLAAFVVGPGFLPVPGKTVTNIISGQYIDLATLLAKPSDMRSPSPLIYIDRQVVVSQASKPARRLTDIAQWLQAFAIYMLIMVTYLLSRAAALINSLQASHFTYVYSVRRLNLAQLRRSLSPRRRSTPCS